MTALLLETSHDLAARLNEELRRQQGQKLSRREVRCLVRSTEVLAETTLSAWGWVRETLEEEGFEGRELARHGRMLLEGIDESLALHEQLLALALASSLAVEDAGLPNLEAKLSALREARPKVAAVLALATQPARPVDAATLAGAKAALERGEFVTLDDDYLARLRGGEDL
jgi:hypothetical protein